MPVIQGGNVIRGAYGLYLNAGVPVNGTDEVQRLTIGGTPTGGTFKLAFDGLTTGAITWSSTNSTLFTNIKNALEALGNIDEVTVEAATITNGIGTLDITFSGANVAKKNQSTITVPYNDLEGTNPTLAIAVQTAGVDATQRGAAQGALLYDTANGKTYRNDSAVAQAPDWQFEASPVSVAKTIVDASAGGTGQTANCTLIPANSILLDVVAVIAEAFNGDTTTTLEVGVSGNVDKYVDTADFDPSGSVGTAQAMTGGGSNDQGTTEFVAAETQVIATWTNTASADEGIVDVYVIYADVS